MSQALLRSDCFPAQMENWPAMDAEQMEAIKQIIDASDYFVVISAGKYGSVNPETGLSYTEMEYDYAMEIGKPIIRLLHRDPFGALRGDQIESDSGAREKLEAFQAKMKAGSVCSFWENADQLEKETVFALVDLKKRKPTLGWVKADGRASKDVQLELEKTRADLAEARGLLARAENNGSEIEAINLTISRIRAAFSKMLGADVKNTNLDRYISEVISDFDSKKFDDIKMLDYSDSLPDTLKEESRKVTKTKVMNLLIVLDCLAWIDGEWKYTPFGERVDSFFIVSDLLEP